MGLFGTSDIEKLKTKRKIFKLIDFFFYEKDGKIQDAAVEALVEIGEPAVDKIILTLKEKITKVLKGIEKELPNVRKTGLQTLKDGFLQGIELAKKSLVEYTNNAVITLDRIGQESIEKLIESMKSDDDKDRTLYIETLRQIDSPIGGKIAAELMSYGEKRKEINEISKLIINLKSEIDKVRRDAAHSLAKKGEAAVEFILPVLKDPYSGARAGAVYTLGKIGDKKNFEPILEMLKDENIHVQSLAIAALGKLKDSRAVDFILPFLNNREKNVRISTLGSLNMIGDPKAIHYLTAAFFNEDDEELSKMLAREILSEFNHEKKERCLKIMYIGYIRSAKDIEMLIEGLSSEDSDIRWLAAGSLGRIKDERAIEPLIEALKDENRRVRLIAAEALGKTSNERAYMPLKKLLEDSDSSVQKALLSSILCKFFKDR